MYKRGKCEERMCDGVLKRCVSSRKYGEFCDVTQGTRDCGVDGNGVQMVCKITANLNKFNACRYEDESQETDQYCGMEEECKSKLDGCNGTEAERKIGKGICGKLDNGRPIGYEQTFCGNNFTRGYISENGHPLGTKCKSGWACGGHCSCLGPEWEKEGKGSQLLLPEAPQGRCSDTEYCDWWSGHSRKCQPLRDNGESTGEVQTGCGDNGTQ